jgi:hypothetical protein
MERELIYSFKEVAHELLSRIDKDLGYHVGSDKIMRLDLIVIGPGETLKDHALKVTIKDR